MAGKSSTPAVLYAAKSSPDEHDSVEDQLRHARTAAEREDRNILNAYGEENQTGYRGDRGPELEAAMSAAVQAADEHGHAELWVFHSSRLARGSGRKNEARGLMEVFTYLRRKGVTLRSVQDDPYVTDSAFIGMAEKMANKYAEDLSGWVKAGQRRRFESGKRLGSPIRDGYKLQFIELAGGRPVQALVLDAERATIWERIFEMVERGHTPGEIRQALNAEGIRTKRGKPWTTRAIRRGVRDDFYAGRAHAYGETIEDDHEPLIEPERWERIAAMVASGPRARTVKNPPRDWLLQGISNCGLCGSTLYTRSDRRTYVCKSVRESRGTCDALPIPAETAEQLVLDHLHDFVGDVEEWLSGQARAAVNERDQFAKSLEAQRAERRKLSVKVEKAREQWERHLGEDDDAADAALRGASRLEGEADHLADVIASMEERLADWPTAPDVDAALDFL
jgi:site-specific DNA recombinase